MTIYVVDICKDGKFPHVVLKTEYFATKELAEAFVAEELDNPKNHVYLYKLLTVEVKGL